MERTGVARSVATKVTAHRSESVYRRYAIASDIDLQEAAEVPIEAKALSGGSLSSLAERQTYGGRWTMRQTREPIAPNLAARVGWQVAQRDDARVARRLYRKPVLDGV
jgi:hypothetical protein